MSGWKPKRFWKATTIAPAEGGGWAVMLDNRMAKTPGKLPLVLPTEALAEAVAAEWAAQDGVIRPETMPFTRSANAALEKVAPQKAEVVAMLAAYGGTDLLCYRATGPEGLVARQAEVWDPLLDWAAEALGARLVVTSGVIPVDQPEAATERLHALTEEMSNFQIAAFHDLVALSGSLILAFAVVRGRLGAEAAWDASRIDEAWQIALWGEDEEAAAFAAAKRRDFLQAEAFWTACTAG